MVKSYLLPTLQFVVDYVCPILAVVAYVSLAVAIGFGGAIMLGYGGGDLLPVFERAIINAGTVCVASGAVLLMLSLCLCAWAAAEVTGEWVVRRSALYRRSQSEIQFWMEAHGLLYEEYSKLVRAAAKQEQPQVAEAAPPANDYW